MRDPVNYLGPVGLGLVCAGVWARFGWPYAAIIAGVSLVGLYLFLEVWLVRPSPRRKE